MDDQNFDDFFAGLFTDSGPESETPPTGEPNELSLQAEPSEVSSPSIEAVSSESTSDSVEVQTPEPQAAVAEEVQINPEYLAYVQQLEEDLARRRFAEEQANRLIAERQRQERDNRVNEISRQLGEWDPALQRQYVEGHQSINKELIEVHQEVGKLNSVLEAVTLALEHDFDEATVDHVVERAKSLMHLPHEARVETLSREREVHAQANQEVNRLKAEKEELLKRIEAIERDPNADRVEGSPVAPSSRDWEKTDNFDDFFNAWYPQASAVA